MTNLLYDANPSGTTCAARFRKVSADPHHARLFNTHRSGSTLFEGRTRKQIADSLDGVGFI